MQYKIDTHQSREKLKNMRIAIQGCCHGELNTLYNTLLHIQTQESIHIDLLLICGDFQVRLTFQLMNVLEYSQSI